MGKQTNKLKVKVIMCDSLQKHTIFWPTNCLCEPKNTRPLLGQTNILQVSSLPPVL